MDNLKKLNEIFKEVFVVSEDDLIPCLNRDDVPEWDSIHQLSLLSFLEDSFDVMLDGEDALGITSYERCKEVLSSKYNIIF